MKKRFLSIDNYLTKEGLKKFVDPERYWSWVDKQLDEPNLKKYLYLMERRFAGIGLGKEEFYNFISSNELSVIANAFDYEILKVIANWIETKLPEKGKILEMGCHTGLLTRYYALIRPNAHVIGVDINHKAIETAKKQAKQRGIHNISYLQCDLRKPVDVSLRNIDCIISGRVFGEVMSNVPRFQLSWDKISYPPVNSEMDNDAKDILTTCHSMLAKKGQLLLTERISDYDRLNRLWLLVHKAGFSSTLSTITPQIWSDITGKHRTWFFEALKEIQPKTNPIEIEPLQIPVISKSVELVDDETRILFKGTFAFQLFNSLNVKVINLQYLLKLSTEAIQHIEVGLTEGDLGYAFIGSNFGEYLLTLCLESELNQVKADVREYLFIHVKNGAKIIKN